jgi:hypothetical protein
MCASLGCIVKNDAHGVTMIRAQTAHPIPQIEPVHLASLNWASLQALKMTFPASSAMA